MKLPANSTPFVMALVTVVIIIVLWRSFSYPIMPVTRPTVETPPLPPLPATRSQLTMSLVVPTSVIEDAVNEAIPWDYLTTSREYRVPWAAVLKFSIWARLIKVRGSADLRRGRLTIRHDSDGFRFTGAVTGSARGHVSGLPDPRISVRARVSAQAQPRLRSDWIVVPNYTTRVRITTPRVPKIPVPGLDDINLSGWLDRQVEDRIDSYESRVQSNVSRSIKRIATDAWAEMCQAFQIYSNPDLWLTMRPETAHTTQVLTDGENLVLHIGVTAETSVSGDSSRPQCEFPQRLIIRDEQEPVNIEATLPINLRYPDLSTVIAQEVVGTDVGGDLLTIDSIAVYPHGTSLLVEAQVRESRARLRPTWEGTVYIAAKPQLSADGRQIELTDVTIDTESEYLLQEIIGEVAEPLLAGAIDGKKIWDLEPVLRRIEEEGNEALGRLSTDRVNVDASVDRVELTRIDIGPQALRLVVTAKGEGSGEVSESER